MSAVVISFSVSEEDKGWWEQFAETIPPNERSKYLLRIVKDFYEAPGISDVERKFNKYCMKNNLSKDAQLGLLMGPYRVCGGIDDDDFE